MSRLLKSNEIQIFKELLDGYKLNKAAAEIFKKSNFVVIAGPAGGGKDTLRNGLLTVYPDIYQTVLSTTTRPPRVGEQDGKDYHFREVEQIKKGLIEQEFFQAALIHEQQVSCLHINDVKKLRKGQIGLSILVPAIENMLRNLKSDLKTIFLIPPSLNSLDQRIQSERLLNEAEINRRKDAAIKEIKFALGNEDYYCVISETRKGVANIAHEFYKNNKRDKQVDTSARAVMKKIMLELSNERKR